MRRAIKIVIVVLYVLLAAETLLWVALGAPPIRWRTWYLLIVPLGAFVFWPGKRCK